MELYSFFLTIARDPSLWFHVDSSIMQASHFVSGLYVRNLHCGPSPYCCKVSFFFLIYQTYIFILLLKIQSFPYSSLMYFPYLLLYSGRVQNFVLTLTFLHGFSRLHQLTPGASTSVSEFESCVCFSSIFSISPTYHAFIHIMECVRLPELHSFGLMLEPKVGPNTLQLQMFSQWYRTRISSS